MAEEKTSKLATKSLGNLPDDILMTKVLPRAPVRSLLRFETVSKEWKTLISSVNFAKFRLKCGSSSPQFLLVHQEVGRKGLLSEKCNILSLSYDNATNTLKDLVQLQCLEIEELYDGFYSIVDTRNGLVCLSLINIEAFGMWNPATRQFRHVFHPQQMLDNEHVTPKAEGFGYVSSTDDYKIFTMFIFYPCRPISSTTASFYLFSFKSGLWKELTLLIGAVFKHVDVLFAVCIGEKLYWPRKNMENGNVLGLFSFDLVGEDMIEVSVSTYFSDYGYNNEIQIFEMNGCLSLCCSKNGGVSHIWTFEAVGNLRSSWVKLFSFDRRNMSILSFNNTGMYLVYDQLQFKLVDPREEGLDHLGRGIDYNVAGTIRNSRHYVPSLVSFRICDHVDDDNEQVEA